MVGGVDLKNYLEPGSLNIDDTINARSVIAFKLKADKNVFGYFTFEDWGLVSSAYTEEEDRGSISVSADITEDWGDLSSAYLISGVPVNIIFDNINYTGSIDTVEHQDVTEQSDYIIYTISVTDNHQICDKHKIVEVFEDETISDIMDYIVTNYLSEDGITIGEITNGDIVVSELICNYISASDVFDKLAEKTGAIWYVDKDKKLYMLERSESISDYVLDDDFPYMNLKVKDHRQNYRNVQYLIGGKAETEIQTEHIIAYENQTSFLTGYPIYKVPAIYVDDVEKTVGIKDVEEGKDFYWNKESDVFTTSLTLSGGEDVKIVYTGAFPITAKATDESQILERAGIERNGGKYEDAETISNVGTLSELLDLALTRLRQYGKMGKEITFYTKQEGLEAGDTMYSDLPKYNVNNMDLLILRVTISEDSTFDNYLYYVEAVSGEAVGGWVEFFKKLISPDKEIEIENSVENICILRTLSRNWIENEIPNILRPVYPSETLFPSETLGPMFDDGKQVMYISLYDSLDVEIYRKYRTSQKITSDKIETIFVFLLDEANGNIAKVKFWGGTGAAIDSESGVLVDTQTFVFEKTDKSVLQITKIDIKGW